MTDSSLKNLPNLHAALRLRDGYDLHQIVSEYRMLRLVIFETFAEKGPIADEARPRLAPLRIMNAALDTAIADAVDQVAIERERSRQLFMDILSHDLRDR